MKKVFKYDGFDYFIAFKIDSFIYSFPDLIGIQLILTIMNKMRCF